MMKKNISRPQAGLAAPVRRTASKSSELRSQGSIVSPSYSLKSTHCINIIDTALLISGSSVVIDWPVSVVAVCCTEHHVKPGFHKQAAPSLPAHQNIRSAFSIYVCLSWYEYVSLTVSCICIKSVICLRTLLRASTHLLSLV